MKPKRKNKSYIFNFNIKVFGSPAEITFPWKQMKDKFYVTVKVISSFWFIKAPPFKKYTCIEKCTWSHETNSVFCQSWFQLEFKRSYPSCIYQVKFQRQLNKSTYLPGLNLILHNALRKHSELWILQDTYIVSSRVSPPPPCLKEKNPPPPLPHFSHPWVPRILIPPLKWNFSSVATFKT